MIIAKLLYTSKYEEESDVIACDEDEEQGVSETKDSSPESEILWDMNRPFIGDCSMRLLKFDDPEAKTVRFQSCHRNARILTQLS